MKTILILAGFLLVAGIAEAQLKDTKWKGNMNVPSETAIVLDFKQDSLNMIIADNGIVGETMTYSVKDSIITIVKISGNSPCTTYDTGKLKYVIKGDKLFIDNLSDPCDARAGAWLNEPFVRIKE